VRLSKKSFAPFPGRSKIPGGNRSRPKGLRYENTKCKIIYYSGIAGDDFVLVAQGFSPAFSTIAIKLEQSLSTLRENSLQGGI
jgi:hypothetical protein